jgi:hypothetical protein
MVYIWGIGFVNTPQKYVFLAVYMLINEKGSVKFYTLFGLL